MGFRPPRATYFFLLCVQRCVCFNIGTSGARIFSGPQAEEFGYTVQQFSNHQGRWLLVGSPWSGYQANRKGDVYHCDVAGTSSTCQKLNLPDSISLPVANSLDVNMSLGLTLTRTADGHFLTCGPLWAQRCGNQYFLPGVCSPISPLFKPRPAFAPALQACGGPMDVVVVLDGSNSIYPWEPVTAFLEKLLENLDIGPDKTQVSVVQYGSDSKVEFYLNTYATKAAVVVAATKIQQKLGLETHTFEAIDFARQEAFRADKGARPGASRVMVVVTDGESHDKNQRDDVIRRCQEDGITRYGIAVLGYYIRNDQDTTNLVAEIQSIASPPADRHFFNVSDETALVEIAATLGDRIFNIEGTGQGNGFNMEMSQVGFSAHQTRDKDTLLLGAVGAYSWSGTVVHQTSQKTQIFPEKTFSHILQDKNHSSLLGYSVSTLYNDGVEYFVAGAPRSNHTGQIVVYILDSRGQPQIVDTQRGEQIGSYYGSILCPLDVDGDGQSNGLLVSAPSYMGEQQRENGRVYLLSFAKGTLTPMGTLNGPPPGESSRFGQALAAAGDLDLDGLGDAVVGAPLEEDGTGAVYVFTGYQGTLRTQYSQRIAGSKLDSGLRFFGRSLDATFDINADLTADLTVGARGKVVQLWSRGVAVVIGTMTFDPAQISVLSRDNQPVSSVKATMCLKAKYRPNPPVGPLVLQYNLTLDADLQSSRLVSRGRFTGDERQQLGKVILDSREVCEQHLISIKEAPDLVSPLSVRMGVSLLDPESNPVLDPFSPTAWAFSIPFSKDCGSDEVCETDLHLHVKIAGEAQSLSERLVSSNNKRLSFVVTLQNRKENSYNTRVTASYSPNLYYSSVTTNGQAVDCLTSREMPSLSCKVRYPVLEQDEEVTFVMNFELNLNLRPLQRDTAVTFNALSDSSEVNPSDNEVALKVPLIYDSELSISRESSLNFVVIDGNARRDVESLDDIGPEFNFIIKVSTGNFPVSLSILSIFLPTATPGGNPLLFLSAVKTEPSGDVTCDATIGQRPNSASFRKENLLNTKQLDCDTASCEPIRCVLKNMALKSDFYVNVTTRIWNGTFAEASFQALTLTVKAEIKTDVPDLLIVTHPQLTVGVSISKPGAKGEVPVGVIVGSVLGGLLLLAVLVATLWKLGFFKRKYRPLEKEEGEEGEEGEMEMLQSNPE
ncbi:integrin alpha-2-like [Polymixia lowei]